MKPEVVANDYVIFVIGRPCSGKSTVVRHILRVLDLSHKHTLDDFDLLLKRATQDRNPKRIKRRANGQFEILDPSILDDVLEELWETVVENRGKRPMIVEFSRAAYVETFAKFRSLTLARFAIVYVKAPLEVCIERNERRGSALPLRMIPDWIMRDRFQNDDLDLLKATYPRSVRIIDNSHSLALLERETELLLGELLGHKNLSRLSQKTPRKEVYAGALLMSYLAVFALVAFVSWQAVPGSLFSALGPSQRLELLRTVFLVSCAGGLGGTTYCIRALYHYYIKGEFDFDRYKWWLVFRPVTGSVLALAVFALVQGGVAAVGAPPSPSHANLAWFGFGYMTGFSTEQVIEWLRRGSKSVFGESRVQPERHDERQK